LTIVSSEPNTQSGKKPDGALQFFYLFETIIGIFVVARNAVIEMAETMDERAFVAIFTVGKLDTYTKFRGWRRCRGSIYQRL